VNASTRSAVQPFPEHNYARDRAWEVYRQRISPPTAGVYALLKLWLLAAFIGASAAVGAAAMVVEGRQPLRIEVVLASIVLGAALTWYSIRRMRMLLGRLDDASTEDWTED
jgi:hypothetical protein